MDYGELTTQELEEELRKCDEGRRKFKETAKLIKSELSARKVFAAVEKAYNDLPEEGQNALKKYILKPKGIPSEERVGTPGAD